MEKRKRNRQVKFHLSNEEFEAFDTLLKEHKITKQEFFLHMIYSKKIQSRNFPPELHDLVVELKREGNNLNQIAKRLNEGGYVSYEKELRVDMRRLNELWQRLSACLVAKQE